MFEQTDVMRLAQDLARYSGARQSQVARNIANADTPGYRAKDLEPFAASLGRDAKPDGLRSTRTGHLSTPLSSVSWQSVNVAGQASPNGNTVSLETEMVRATRAKSTHDLALTVYRSSLDVLRTALGRGR